MALQLNQPEVSGNIIRSCRPESGQETVGMRQATGMQVVTGLLVNASEKGCFLTQPRLSGVNLLFINP